MHIIEVGFIYSKFLHNTVTVVAILREAIQRIKS
jgi:hypothetical protein